MKDLTVSGSVSGDWNVGGVVGYNNGGTVTGCIFSGSGSVSGGWYVGGVVGYNSSGTVENCYNTGSVKGSGNRVGGVVGVNSGSVTNSYNTSSVKGNWYVGGVVGSSDGRITNCYNTGSVTRIDSTYVGGVVGHNGINSSVTNCYFLSGTADNGIGGGSGTSSNVEARTDDAFHSGEVAWRLQAGQKAAGEEDPIPQVWGQSNLNTDKSWPTLSALDNSAQPVYKVTFDYGASFTDNDKHYAYSYTNGVVSEPDKNPALAGHTLSGWYSDSSLTTAWNFDTEISNDTTLYAKWTPVAEPDPEPEEPPYSGKYSYEISTDIGAGGYEDGTFKPNDAITREQLAAILMNYSAYKGEDVSARADLTNYTDQPSAWAEETMSWAVAEGLISGVTNTELQPQGNATRAQVAAILQRFLCK